MGDRITVKDLRAVCARINRWAGFAGDAQLGEPAYWTSVALWTQQDGRNIATVGMFYVDGAYGGWSLYRMMNEAGGVTDVLRSGHVPARELYGLMHAYLEGIDAATSVTSPA